MKSYEETMSDYQESVGLGYSARETISAIEDDDEANETALKELKDALKFGI